MVSITLLSGSGLGQLVGKSARLVIELRVRIAAGEFSSPESLVSLLLLASSAFQ